jgi:alpha,alpha-trehalase
MYNHVVRFHREDIMSAQTFKTDNDKENYYSELKAAAESGWDFSSRWFILNGTNKGKSITSV